MKYKIYRQGMTVFDLSKKARSGRPLRSAPGRIAAAKAQAKEPVLLGHDLVGMERFLPESKHMVTLDILNSDSPVGFPGERYRFFLSDEGYQNARASEKRGEIKIRSHAAVCAGKLFPDRKSKRPER